MIGFRQVVCSFWTGSRFLRDTSSGQIIDPSVGLTWDDRIQIGVEEVPPCLRQAFVTDEVTEPALGTLALNDAFKLLTQA
jgi:hypothetical protein